MKIKAVPRHDLIVTIVKKGWCERVINAARNAGSEGATIVPARGIGIREQKKLLGIPIEPEKDMVLTLVLEEKTEKVLEAIIQAVQLEKPGTGIAFVVELKKVVGAVHLLREMEEEELESKDEEKKTKE